MQDRGLIAYKDKLEQVIDRYGDFLGDEAANLAQEHGIPAAKELQANLTAIEDENRLLKIGIVGRVKSGKSSLLNALLFAGESILPKAATPMTASLTTLSYGESQTAEVEFFTQEDLNLPSLAQSLLDQGADIEAKATLHASISPHLTTLFDKMGVGDDERELEDCTPLHIAAVGNARETAETLIQNGANISAKDNAGATPLHIAAVGNARETAEALIQNGADVHAKDNEGFTPLFWAAWNDAASVASVLLEQGADVHAKD